MVWNRGLKLGAALLLGGLAAQAQAQQPLTGVLPPSSAPVFVRTQAQAQPTPLPGALQPGGAQPAQPGTPTAPEQPGTQTGPGEPTTDSRQSAQAADAGTAAAPDEPALGPTPINKVGILQELIFGENAEESKIKVNGWMDFDYTYRSTGRGQNNIAPVMNRFGDEALARQLGLYIYKPLDEKCWDWGFNALFIAGSDASFLGPTAGYYANTNPRFGTQFTDLNLTAHLPILTDGGVDVKLGRQTTVLGPMGAIAWQRTFDSSDYAWYNLEEGRYTGVSANWKISKQLSWYNGLEVGGWGVFFDTPVHGVDYITQLNYWLDEDAKVTKVWATVLTGPTGFTNDGNTTTVELGVQHNYNSKWWQIVDFQATYSKAPIFFQPPPGYQERAYDVYTYIGYHLNCEWDINSRLEWYKDVDGGGYPGGFGIPHTNFYESTLGLNYHPTKWLEFRPEVRYDHATNPAFGSSYDKKNQVTIATEVLLKF